MNVVHELSLGPPGGVCAYKAPQLICCYEWVAKCADWREKPPLDGAANGDGSNA